MRLSAHPNYWMAACQYYRAWRQEAKAISISEYQGRAVSEYGSVEARHSRIGTGAAAVGIMRLGQGALAGSLPCGMAQRPAQGRPG